MNDRTIMAISANRGKISTIILKTPIIFNGHKIVKAVIELDHINYGLNSKTKELNIKKRSNFSNKDIEKFINLLDGEDLAAERFEKKWSIFMHFIKCPIKGKFENKEFVMIFKIEYGHNDEIYTVTLFPNW
jgi:uncharacterized protein YifE (UPF0438 family)